jgi:antitoxin component YwqK of YwqJK toxin-antitoxin module
MKQYLLSISLIFYCSISFAQIKIEDLEKVGELWTKKGDSKPYTGDFKETFDNGTIKGTGSFVNGKLEGLRIQYYPNGKKETEKEYKGSYPHGKAKEFYENGTLEKEGEFINNKEHGTWTLYHANGQQKAILNFEDGVQNGPYFEYDEQGNLTKQYYFKKGKAEYSDAFMQLANEAVKLSKQYKNQEAISLYNKAIEINPTVAQAYFNRGACKGNLFDFEGAVVDYDKAISLDPNYMKAYGNRGTAKINLYTTKGTLNPTLEQTASACEDFNKAKELGDKSGGTEEMMYLYCKKNKKKK